MNGSAQVIDSHAHYWQWPRERGAAKAAKETAAQAGPAYSHGPVPYDDLLALLDRAGVDKLVQVTRTAMAYDNDYSLEGARAHPDRIRVLGRFDARPPDVRGRLEEWIGDPLVVGVRVHELPPHDAWLEDGTLAELWRAAEELEIPVSVYAPDRPDVLAAVAREHEGLTVVADHVALNVMPDSDPASRFASWDGILDLARLANVCLKVSGLPEATDERHPFPRAQERLRQLYDTFGPRRLMWGSNYPPTARVCSYEESLALVRDHCDFVAAEDRAEILGGTAARAFSLPW